MNAGSDAHQFGLVLAYLGSRAWIRPKRYPKRGEGFDVGGVAILALCGMQPSGGQLVSEKGSCCYHTFCEQVELLSGMRACRSKARCRKNQVEGRGGRPT